MKRALGIFCLTSLACGMNAHALTLEAAMQRTLQNNPLIQQAKIGVEEAAGKRLVLRSIAYPDANLRGVAGAQGGHRVELDDESKVFGFVQGNFAQNLFHAAIPASLRRGNLELLIAKQQLNVVVTEQLHRTRLAFYTALYNRALETQQRSQQRDLEANISAQEQRYQAGTSQRESLTGAQLQAHEIGPEIELSRRARDAALLDLATAMGMNLSAGARLPEPEGELQFVDTGFEVATETEHALDRRADLKLARLLVQAADEEKRIVQADYYPSVQMIASGDYIPITGIRREGGGSPSRADDFISSEIRAGAAYNWRIIDNGKVGGAVLQRKEAHEINKVLLSKLEAGVRRELTRIDGNLRAVRAQHASLAKAADVAQQNVVNLRGNVLQGLASQLEYREGENDLLKARNDLLNATYEQNMARAEWDLVAGRYFQFSDDSAANVP